MNKKCAIYKENNFLPSKKMSLMQNIPVICKFINILTKVHQARNNPRNYEYMCKLAEEKISGHIDIFNCASTKDLPQLSNYKEIILLWPDAIGHKGWSKIENFLFRNLSQQRVYILNGRRRFFLLDSKTRTHIFFRRLLNNLWLGEIFFTFCFIIISPVFLLIDLISGRLFNEYKKRD